MTTRTAYRLANNRPTDIGSTVTDFRGDTGILESVTRANEDGRDGKVVVDGREYYARVWGLRVANG